MNNIADCLEKLERISGINRVEIASEMECLFSCGRDLYENADKKRKLLGSYTKKCAHNISGDTVIVRIDEIISERMNGSQMVETDGSIVIMMTTRIR